MSRAILDKITDTLTVDKKVQVISCTFHELVNTCNSPIPNSIIRGQLSIPEYQRPYIWKEKHINRLLEDFREYNLNKDKEKSLFYFGSIILHQDGNQLKIIDGQQRITTLLLIYSFIDPTFKSGIQYSAPFSIQTIKRNFSYLKSVQKGENFDYSGMDMLSCIDLNKINVTLVITATEDLAYTFFETQNTGGVKLSGSDIIKAHHLRAISAKKLINYQARRWEGIDPERVELVIQNLTKIRFWDNRKWRLFPFYRDKKTIKEILISEFTEDTKHDQQDISYYYTAVKNVDGRAFQIYKSHIKQLKQPLSDGNNTLDYINDYVQLHDILFVTGKSDYRVSDSFYAFNKALMHGNSGTLYLKELLEICIVAYVSRFGFYRLYEASLWLYRAVYSLRVSFSRNVREDSVFKFVYDNQFVDNILEVYTTDQLFRFLKIIEYEFNKDNATSGRAKDKHLGTLKNYFDEFKTIKIDQLTSKNYDQVLLKAISNKINKNDSND